MTTPTSTGMNRTGMQMAPLQSGRMLEISNDSETRPGDELSPFSQMRRQSASDSAPVGSVPPPGSMKGMATTAMQMLKGNKPTVFIDKLGERLAFERSGVRLYEAVLTKFDALGSWDGGPSRADLEDIRNEELEHFEMLKQTIDQLGADPTAMTPSADMVANESSGILKVVSDPRMTLAQSLHAMLVAERADVEGWGLLVGLAENIGQDELAQRFRQAEATEEEHGRKVRSWLTSSVLADANREMSGNQSS